MIIDTEEEAPVQPWLINEDPQMKQVSPQKEKKRKKINISSTPFQGIPALNGAAVDIRMERDREARNAATTEYVIKRRIQWAAYEKAKAEERARIGPHPMPYDERELRDERDRELLGRQMGRHTPQGRPLEHWE